MRGWNALTETAPTEARPRRLRDELRALIVDEGPLTVARFMSLALGHPTHGYYMTRDPFGAAGDFTTAPEISQMFGELLGLWAAEVWMQIGRPDPVRLVELGPGRGTLMADALRAARAVPPFRQALDVHLVEISPVLREVQRRTLAAPAVPVTWHTDLETVPRGPMLVLTNEFFDALPIRQFQRTERGWCERLIGLDGNGQLAFGLAAEPASGLAADGPLGTILEVAVGARESMRQLCGWLAAEGGALLAIDYGPARSGFGDTLQAVKGHHFVDPLADPGEADLTAHVDFTTLAQIAAAAGLAIQGPVTQGRFLRQLGLPQRAAALMARATPDQAAAMEAAALRLAGPHPGMGDLFKVLAVGAMGAPTPPGFASEI